MMIGIKSFLLLSAVIFLEVQCQGAKLPPQFEINPQYSNSYLPPSMQIIAYLTELMKYDLKPTNNKQPTTTTTVRPTPSHRPGLYAPNSPLGPQVYFAQRSSYAGYVHRLRNPELTQYLRTQVDSSNWDASSEQTDSIHKILKQLDPSLRETEINDLDVLGQGPVDLYKLINNLEDDYAGEDEDVRVQKFFENYDDSNYKSILTKQKKQPPTRAYVTLLSLYDLLNKESKKLGLNKFNGYSVELLRDLYAISTGTSSYQLRYVLNKIVANKDTQDATLLKKVTTLIADLDQTNSYINDALRYIPALAFDYE